MLKISAIIKFILDFIVDFLNRKATDAAKEKLKESKDEASIKVQIAKDSADELERLVKSYESERSNNVRRRIVKVPKNRKSTKRSNSSLGKRTKQ